ncbi:MAG TPA: rhodanese-like domain-containing protein [Candidatus Aminicenantes bacterium]|nr:rhodanese-like domain-containing protein [Candidatus Aminicenantes bacterium]
MIDFSRPGERGRFQDGATHLRPVEALELAQIGAVFVDIREAYETNFRVFAVPEVLYLEWSRFREGFADLPKDCPLILCDAVGTWSLTAAAILREAGYANLAVLIGGMVDWEKDGFPIRKDKDYELSGQCSCKLKPRIGGNPLKKRADAGLTGSQPAGIHETLKKE